MPLFDPIMHPRFALVLVIALVIPCGIRADEAHEDFQLYMKGRYVYERHCALCHGETGRGNGSWAAELEVKPRNFRSGIFKFRTTAFGSLPVDADLRRTIRSGISGTAMPVFAQLRDDEVDSVIAYVKSLSRAWRDPSLAPRPVPQPDPPAWLASDQERAAHTHAGRERFAQLCASCHGPDGQGDGEAGKGLIDGWGNPIAPAKLAAPHHKSGDSPKDLYRTISTGFNGTPMVGYATTLKEEEIWDLVACIWEWRASAGR